MRIDQISFDEEEPLPQPDPVRMDGVCFVGYLAERRPVLAGAALRDRLDGIGLLSPAEKLTGPVTLIDRPVTIASLSAYEALFDGDARLDQLAEVTGGRLPEVIAGVDLALPLVLIIDGVLREIALPAQDSTPEEIATALVGHGLAAEILRPGGEPRLRLSLPPAHGPGRIAVLAHPPLGFPRAVAGEAQRVGTAMDVAIRQFFAMGGALAHVVSLGPPLPLFGPREARTEALGRLLALPGAEARDVAALSTGPLPPPHLAATTRTGILHLYGLDEAAFLLLPDLPDLCARDRRPVPEPAPAAPRVVAFAECLPTPAPRAPDPLALVVLAEMDAAGLAMWQAALARVLRLIGDHRRDLHLVAALPRPIPGIDLATALPDSAFLMLAAPALLTPFSSQLPARAMEADGVLAGQLATLLTSDAPHGSAAATSVPMVTGLTDPAPLPVNAFSISPNGCHLDRDITASSDPAWRAGPASRMAALLLRQAQVLGQDLVFAPISAALQRRVVLGFEAVLATIAAQGGLRPGPADPGYDVICDARTMTAHDIDTGVLRAEVSFRPALPIEAIQLSLPLTRRVGATQ